MVEQKTHNLSVAGSIPAAPTIKRKEMKRWHEEIAIMEKQRKMDLEEHRSFVVKHGRGKDPDDFECKCKVARSMFRKHKQWACSCKICRYETYTKRLERRRKRRIGLDWELSCL